MRRNARIVWLSLLLLVMAGAAGAQQQPSAAATRLDQDTYRYAVAEERRTVFAANIGLSVEERLRFWPIYDEYEKEREPLEKERFSVLSRYAQSYTSLSDDAAFALAGAAGKVQIQELQLRLKYADTLRRKMSGRLAARFFQIDDYVTTMMRANTLGGVPLAAPPAR
jgi:hypothetical protein